MLGFMKELPEVENVEGNRPTILEGFKTPRGTRMKPRIKRIRENSIFLILFILPFSASSVSLLICDAFPHFQTIWTKFQHLDLTGFILELISNSIPNFINPEPAMVAAYIHNRIGHDFPVSVRRELPTSERERKDLWGDTVLEAVMALRDQLNSKNEQIVAAAANSILELERTRMRHDKLISGTEPIAAPNIPVEVDDPARLNEHVQEFHDYMEQVGQPISATEAKAFVVEKVTNWQV